MGESQSHRELKRAALFWAQVRGYRIAAWEVRVPNSGYRADVAAYRPESRENGARPGTTVLFECKQSRPDFLNDSRPVQETLERLGELHERRRRLEDQLGVHYPSLRVEDSLFPEFQSFRFEELDHQGYRRLMREIRILENRVYGKTKFDRLVRYRCAHFCYLVTIPGIVEEHEVPLDWGWLELGGAVEGSNDPGDADARAGDEGSEAGAEPVGELLLRKKPVRQEVPEERVLEWLQGLGLKGTGHANRDAGISPEAVWEARRGGG